MDQSQSSTQSYDWETHSDWLQRRSVCIIYIYIYMGCLFRLNWERYLKQSERVETLYAMYSLTLYAMYSLTLKQTQREKGRVRRTRPQENMVRSQPHSPIPSSLSSAKHHQLTVVATTVTGDLQLSYRHNQSCPPVPFSSSGEYKAVWD